MSKVVGENVSVEVDGEDLVIRLKHARRGEKSSSGKSTIVSTTRGFTQIETPSGNLGLSLNLTTK